jgi:non-ribosomal peptide synthetase component E (peptide arylation enzyme)
MVVAVVEPSDAAAAPDLPAIVSFLKDAGLMMQKIPERLEIRSDWPRAGTGKIVKKDLREQYSL